MIAFNDRSYGEMVLHPPPLSYLSTILLFFLPCKSSLPAISKGFSYIMFWIENLVFLLFFLIYETLLSPVAYIKIWYNIIKTSSSYSKIFGNCCVWILIGPIMMPLLIVGDCINLTKILLYH